MRFLFGFRWTIRISCLKRDAGRVRFDSDYRKCAGPVRGEVEFTVRHAMIEIFQRIFLEYFMESLYQVGG